MKKSFTKKLGYGVLLALGAVGIVNTILMLTITNVNVGTLLPGTAGLLLVIIALLKLTRYRDRPLVRSRPLRITLLLGAMLSLLSFIGIGVLIQSEARSQEDTAVDTLIILGAALHGETPSASLKARLNEGMDYLNRYPSTQVVVTGGQGFGEAITEAEAMKRYLVAGGIDPERILLEERATSTMENFRYSKELLETRGSDEKRVMIVTNDFHMFRAKLLARRNGFEPLGIVSVTPRSVSINSYVRECLAVIKSYLLDR
ncbi:YdcF family protein [Gorillibacterium sp. CAU 1737]|uniref:YdcF family protein n=1 Tax=Gorillibacterium sp. CAU 1737 TaxID=3140362 RepID=UPI003260D20E